MSPRRSAEPDSPLGTFEEQVMLAVLRVGSDAIGMRVRREIESVTGREIAIGAVYATLDRLEEKGYLHSRRTHGEGGSRRVFEVTTPGARALAGTRDIREWLWQDIDLGELLDSG
jgi:PadR family transcriptional regulator, regulatory protein PadR